MIRRRDPLFPRGHVGEGGGGGGGRYSSIRPLPHHITALYMTMVFSCVIMFHAALVGADVLVYSQATHYLVEGVEFPDAPARFGGQIPLEGVKGMLVYAKPATACSPIDEPPKGRMFTGKWIVLIRRCGCTFEEKVRNAEKAGYDAAIVHNVNSSDLEPMSANGITNITIPSVFVGEESGLIIRERYQYDMGYYIWINDDTPFNINTHLLVPFAIAVGICFMVMVSVMIIKCIKDRIHARRHRLPSSSLKKIPVSKFKKNDPYETCAICLEDYLEGDKLRILPCSHAYHCKCIDPWLTCNRRVCPMCKRKVFAHNERIPDDDDDDDDDSRSGGAPTPRTRTSAVASSDTSEDERAPLISSSRSQSGRSRSGNTRGGGTFRPQRENPFRRAARSLARNPFAAGRSSPQAPREADRNSVSSSTTTTSHEDPNSMVDSTPESSGESANQTEARASQNDPQVVHSCEHEPSSARMSVNSSPADIQDVATLPVDPQEERHQGDLVV